MQRQETRPLPYQADFEKKKKKEKNYETDSVWCWWHTMLGEVLMSSVDNLVINRGSITTDEANWENHASREHTLSAYSLPCVLRLTMSWLVFLLVCCNLWTLGSRTCQQAEKPSSIFRTLVIYSLCDRRAWLTCILIASLYNQLP